MFTGELQSLMLSIALVLPASLVYQRNNTKQGAVKAMVIGTFMNVIVAVFTNLVIIFHYMVWIWG